MKNIPVFTSVEKLAWIIKNKQELIELKKADLKFTDPFALGDLGAVDKALTTNYKDDVATGIIKRTIIGNTYNWMDSSDDVLLDDIFSKSIKDRQDKVFHLHDHKREVTAKVGTPTSIYEKSVKWTDLGVNKSGSTMCLMMDSDIKKDFNPAMFGQYLGGEITQHSVGMYYVSLELAVNDTDMKAEYACFAKYIDRIGNKAKVMEQGYFWAVKEGKLVEVSAVLAGANELTPTVTNEEKEAVQTEIVTIKEKRIDLSKIAAML